MKITRNLGAAVLSLGVLTMGASLTPASAAPRTTVPVWQPCATTKVSVDRPNGGDCDASQILVNRDGSVEFTGTAGKTANIEALKLDIVLLEDSTITFQYNGPCGGGSPRVYVTIGGDIYNTADAAEPCGPAGVGWRTVTYKLETGGRPEAAKVSGWDVAAAGVVFDSGQEGHVAVKDVKLGGVPVDFRARRVVTPPTPTASASVTPTASTSATPTTSASPKPSTTTTTKAPATSAPTPSQSTSAAGLPVTGDSAAKTGLVIGAILVLVGGAAIVVARRRKVSFEA